MVTLDGGTFQADSFGNLTFSNLFQINGTGGTLDSNGVSLRLNGIISDGSGAGLLKIVDSSGAPGLVDSVLS